MQEYVSCPSCGRTLFDLQEISAQIREKTLHLPGVSVSGCHFQMQSLSEDQSFVQQDEHLVSPIADCDHGLYSERAW